MGTDKSLLEYHGVSQLEFMKQLLHPFCSNVFISRRRVHPEENAPVIVDDPVLSDSGPIGGVLTAMRAYPDQTWIVCGCDYPYLEPVAVQQLLKGRATEFHAVAFQHQSTGIVEPLITVYEPSTLQQLEEFFANGGRSLRRFLEAAPVNRLNPEKPEWLTSVDTSEEAIKARIQLDKSAGT